MFAPVNWESVFLPELSILELIVRGVVLYFVIVLILRVLTRHTTGELTAMDLIFILLLAEAATHAMGGYSSIGDCVVLLIVFTLCNYGVNKLTYHFSFFQKLFEQSPIQVIDNGKLNRRNMRRELLTKDELMASLRENGVEDLRKVKKAFVEGDGNISFIFHDNE